MSKRNFILLLIALSILTGSLLIYFYITRPTGGPTGDGSGGGTNFISNFNPFGKSKTVTPNTAVDGENPNNEEENPQVDTSTLSLVKVSSMPIAGYTVFMKERFKDVPIVTPSTLQTTEGDTNTAPTTTTKTTAKPTPPPIESVPALRYVARETGNIFQTFADKIEERQFSDTTIPMVYEAFFGNKGESVIMRYLLADNRTIDTFVGVLPKEILGGDSENTNEIKGSFLPTNIKDMSISSDTSKIFYMFDSGENTIGISAAAAGDKKVQIFDSAFNEWLSWWPTSNIITLTTRPSAQALGYMYTLNPTSKAFTKLIGDVSGLTTLMSPNGKTVLYADSSLTLSLYNVQTRESTTLNNRTLPEKCVWAPNSDFIYCAVPKNIPTGEYPDSWYQGEMSFSDTIWKIDAVTGNGEVVADPASLPGGTEADAIKLMVDGGEKYLFYVNKKDSYLWQLKLEKAI